MILWPDYRTWFEENYNKRVLELLEQGATECNGGPLLRPTDVRYPKQAPWRAEWAIIYPDGKYFRVKELFRPVKNSRKVVGKHGERECFCFHYGNAHPELDPKGYPKTDRASGPPPADLRIDLHADQKPHIHVGTVEHIYQERVTGIKIADSGMFDFLAAVVEHRKSGKPLTDILQIAVLP